MCHVKTRSIVIMMLASIVLASCGVIPATLRKKTLEGHPGFEASAQHARITHKQSLGWDLTFNVVHRGDYALANDDSSLALQLGMEAKWERAAAFNFRPTFTILGYKVLDGSQENMQGLRLILMDGDVEDMEVVGLIRGVKDKFPTRDEAVATFTTFPCRFEMFDDGASLGTVSVHGPSQDSYSLYRKFGFSFDDREYTLLTQSYERLTYATIESNGTLLALFELKPKSGAVNTRTGDFLIGDKVADGREGELLRMVMIADVFTHAVFDDDGPR